MKLRMPLWKRGLRYLWGRAYIHSQGDSERSLRAVAAHLEINLSVASSRLKEIGIETGFVPGPPNYLKHVVLPGTIIYEGKP